jgi:fatty acid desaturase
MWTLPDRLAYSTFGTAATAAVAAAAAAAAAVSAPPRTARSLPLLAALLVWLVAAIQLGHCVTLGAGKLDALRDAAADRSGTATRKQRREG